MIIESPVISVGRSVEFLREHLSNPANLEALLPSEHVTAFACENDQCSFKVTGGFSVIIKCEPTDLPNRVRYSSQKGTPIRFELDIILGATADLQSSLQVVCDADLNPFMKMMAEKPLQAIFSGMAAAAQSAFPV